MKFIWRGYKWCPSSKQPELLNSSFSWEYPGLITFETFLVGNASNLIQEIKTHDTLEKTKTKQTFLFLLLKKFVIWSCYLHCNIKPDSTVTMIKNQCRTFISLVIGLRNYTVIKTSTACARSGTKVTFSKSVWQRDKGRCCLFYSLSLTTENKRSVWLAGEWLCIYRQCVSLSKLNPNEFSVVINWCYTKSEQIVLICDIQTFCLILLKEFKFSLIFLLVLFILSHFLTTNWEWR